MTEKKQKKYCFDTCAFVDSWHRYYSPKVFSALWDNLVECIEKDEIIIPKEVYKEVMVGKDEIANWLKKSKKCIYPYSTEQFKTVTKILSKYPQVSQYHKPTRPNHADPFVVALAHETESTVVTWEVPNGSSSNPSVPTLCKEFGIKCHSMLSFLEEKGWQFSTS